MPVRGKDLTGLVEEYAPLHLAEPWDRVGWQLGDPDRPVDRVLLTLDVGREALLQAGALGAGLVVSHHPLFLQPLPHIRLDGAAGRLIAGFLRQDTALYAAHTNLDRAREGVSAVLARMLGLTDLLALGTNAGNHLKLCVFVPVTHLEQVREALWAAGAGQVGNYDQCSFCARGTGTFRPGPSTDPFVGRSGELARVEEARLETIVPAGRLQEAIAAMLGAHPYEEVAYDLYALQNRFNELGLGWLGSLAAPLPLNDLAGRVKSVLGIDCLRLGGPPALPVRRVAVAGGAGASLWREARARGAQVLVTGEVKYHDGQDMLAEGFCFIEAGHAATERIILPRLASFLADRCRENGWPVEVHLAGRQEEPFRYL